MQANQIHISKGSSKMEFIDNISVNPYDICFCLKRAVSKNIKSVCSQCYAFYALNTFRKYRLPEKLHENSAVLSTILTDEYIPIINRAFFRFNSYGELINLNHLKNIYKIVEKNPFCNFSLYTKRIDFIHKIPNVYKNLIIIYSSPYLNTVSKLPKGFDKVFTVYDKNSKTKKINCYGKCIKCQLCYTHNKTRFIHERLKFYSKPVKKYIIKGV